MKKLLLSFSLLFISISFFGTTAYVPDENYTYVPDDNFEQALINLGYDDVLNDYVLTANIEYITELEVKNQNVSDLTGIEGFSNLEHLDCYGNKLTYLNLSQNSNLRHIFCGSNDLVDLDVSQDIALIILDCSNNQLENIDVSKNVELTSIYCGNNQLTSLDLSLNSNLRDVNCQYNKLTPESLEPLAEQSLEYFRYQPQENIGTEEYITRNEGDDFRYEIVIGGEHNEYHWWYEGSYLLDETQTSSTLTLPNLTEADAGVYICEINNTLLPSLRLFSNEINLSVESSPSELTYVPDDNFEQALIDLGYDDVLDDYVPTANIDWVTDLDVSSRNISNLTGIEGFLSLEILNCSENQIINLDFSSNQSLKAVYCQNNQLDSVNVTQNPSLLDLNCSFNSISFLDVSQNTSLISLNCRNNQLFDLDVSNNSDLGYLFCQNNQLSELNINQNPSLVHLTCYVNDLTNLDISQNPELVTLDCSINQLTDLDYSQNLLLKNLYCVENQLTFGSLQPALNLYLDNFNYSPQDYIGSELTVDKEEGSYYNYTLEVDGEHNLYQWFKNGILLPSQTSAKLNLTYLTMANEGVYHCEVRNKLLPDLTLESRSITLKVREALEGLTFVPDNNFEQALIDFGYDDVLDDYVVTANIGSITELDIVQKGISDLTGLQDFRGLENLRCSYNLFDELDVSQNTLLRQLVCSLNNLTSLDVSNNENLQVLICFYNELESLDLSQNSALSYLSCEYNKLSSLNVSENTALNTLYCDNNQLTFESLEPAINFQINEFRYSPQDSIGTVEYITLNEGESTSYEIYVGGANNQYQWYKDEVALPSQTFASLNLTNLTETDAGVYTCEVTNSVVTNLTLYSREIIVDVIPVSKTYVPDNNFEQALIDLGHDDVLDDYVLTANISDVTNLDVNNQNISDLTGIEDFLMLETLNCSYNDLTNIDVSSNVLLTYFMCDNNPLGQIDVTYNTNLTRLTCSGTQLTSLDVSNNTKLIELNFEGNQISGIDLSMLPNLEYLQCKDNELTSLDVSSNTNLVVLYCFENQISTLDIGNNSNLVQLTCNNNQLTSLDLSQNTSLAGLVCYSNQLTSLDVRLNTSLIHLSCYDNHITSLDLSQNTSLKGLTCYSNQLTSLDLSNNLELTSLFCLENQISTLNISQNTALENLSCEKNNLTSLNVTNNPNLNQLVCYSNQLTFESLEPAMDLLLESFYYSPQDSIGTTESIEKIAGESYSYELQVGGANNQYQWYKDDVALPTQTSATLNLTNLAETDAGVYSCEVTNTVVTGLTLYSREITVDVSSVPMTYVPDDNFEQALIDLGLDDELDDYVVTSNISTVDSLNVNNLSIADLTGVEDFTALEELHCSENQLASLDVSQNLSLRELQCWDNQLSTLDLTNNLALEYLICSTNNLTNLDVSNNVELIELQCIGNSISSLDVSQNTALTRLFCMSNPLTTLDLSKNLALSQLLCIDNQLTSLDVSTNTELTYLWCSSNQLTSIDVSNNSKLNMFGCGDNRLTFESLEPAIDIEVFSYSPQDSIGTTETIEKLAGESYSYELQVGGANNQYQWFKDEVALPTQTSATLNLTNLAESDAGVYTCEVTNTVVTDLTLYSREITLAVEGNNLAQHFHPVWEGTLGLDQMNIYSISAQVDGEDLSPGDEIGIFDGDLCVGYAKLVETIDLSHILAMKVSRDDGSGNGYTPGNEISYKLWDSSTSTEFDVQTANYYDNGLNPVSAPSFEVSATAFVELAATSTICITDYFQEGWNLFSVNSYPQSADMQTLFQDLIDDGSVVKIQDEQGNSIENLGIFGGWVNNIGDIAPTEGYKIKVNTDCSVSVCGTPVDYPFAIPLSEGWNIIGFPQQMEISGMDIVQQLIDNGTLAKVQDESGSSIENLGIFGGWVNNIGNFVPGEGYKIKVTADDVLWIEESYLKSTTILPELVATTHFKTVFEGNGVDHMNINLVELPLNYLTPGDELAVYDGDLCVGSVTILPYYLQKGMVSIAVSSIDETAINGFTVGNEFTLKLWQSATNTEYELDAEIESGLPFFQKYESTILSLAKYSETGFDEIAEPLIIEAICYPNPTNGMVTISLNQLPEEGATVKVYSQSGQVILQRILTDLNTEIDLSANTTGMYYIELISGNSVYTEKIILKID